MGKQKMERKRQNNNIQNQEVDHVEFASENEFIDEIDLADRNEQDKQNFNKRNHRK